MYINVNLRFSLIKHTAMKTYGEVEAKLHAFLPQNKMNMNGSSAHRGNVPHVTTRKEDGRVRKAVWTLRNRSEEVRCNSLRKYWQLLSHGIINMSMRSTDRLENRSTY